MIEKTTRINYLYDFYQALLTTKQRSYMELYYLEDYSLGEISDLHQVSRQAVYDNIKRTETMLESYEQKLRLYERFLKRISILEKMEKETTDQRMITFIQQLKEID
ncbi:putative DNA-binding protein [Oceanobacillus senegalensis]|uniref:putative DNA-binding protein n=1 Tax=Oceanobacillus senegalensis TaxID=1936063 RepID=UPI000A304F62|nr:putative DNA-binding protein [Oceanobacillus senegalensis]